MSTIKKTVQAGKTFETERYLVLLEKKTPQTKCFEGENLGRELGKLQLLNSEMCFRKKSRIDNILRVVAKRQTKATKMQVHRLI